MNQKQYDFEIGTVISGKWNKNRYWIAGFLGNGANGAVYIAQSIFGEVAVKFCSVATTTASEVNVFKMLDVQNLKLSRRAIKFFPKLLDVDDTILLSSSITPFYVMEYVKGENMKAFINTYGEKWLVKLIAELLDRLAILHTAGFIFGDLKTEHLLVTSSGQLRCVDIGGVTKIGKSIKEFTEFFDRGYWQMGTRKADIAYDLFAVAMIIIDIFSLERKQKKEAGLKQLNKLIFSNKELFRFKKVLKKALLGKYETAAEMKGDLPKYNKVVYFLANNVFIKIPPQRDNDNKLEVFFLSLGSIIVYLLYYLRST